MNESRILRRLDDPWKLGIWEMDVSATFIFFLFLGFMKGTMVSFFLFAALGFFAAMRISKLKAMRHTGYLWHFIYWWLPSEFMPLPRGEIPASRYRELVG